MNSGRHHEVARAAHRAALGGGAEELDHVRNVAVAARLQLGLDLGQGRAQFRGRGGVERLNRIVRLVDHMVNRLVTEVDLVKAGAVMKEAAPDQTEFLEGGEAAIDRDQVARGTRQVAVDLFDARRQRRLISASRIAMRGWVIRNPAAFRRAQARSRGVEEGVATEVFT